MQLAGWASVSKQLSEEKDAQVSAWSEAQQLDLIHV